MWNKKVIFILCAFVFVICSLAYSQNREEIGIEKVSPDIFMLTNGGGNIGVFIGEDGVLVIDAGMANFTEKINAALAKIIDKKPIRFLINTHWHYDHVEGNEPFAKAGALIISHDNVYKRKSTDQSIEFFNAKFAPAPKIALPTVTFSNEMTLHINGENVRIVHAQPSHTDGDSVVYFPKANVVHLGDLCFAGMYPFIDTSSGGSVNAIITVLTHLLTTIDDKTKIIPGHGPVTNKTELKAYVAMLTTLRDKISQEIKAGKTSKEIIASKPTLEFDAVWGQGFFKPDQFVHLLYTDLIRTGK